MLFKKISKVTAFLLVTSMILSSCGSSANKEVSPSTETKKEEPQQSTEPEKSEEVKTDVKKTKIVFGGWEGKYMASELAERFEKDNPDIDIEIYSHPKWLGNEEMAKLVASGSMPDIFNLENPVYPVQNDWVIDLKPYLDKETDLELPENFLKYCNVNGKIVMVPNAVFLYGIMVNKDLLASNNIPIPGFDWTIDDLSTIALKTNKKGSTAGITEINPIMKHLPAQMNDALGWGSFDEVKLEYSLSPEWIVAADIAAKLAKSEVNVYERLDLNGKPWDHEEGSDERVKVDEKRKEFLLQTFGEEDTYKAWLKGKIALMSEFSWGMKFDNVGNNPDYAGFDWDFYPFPVKDKGDISRPGIVIDSIGISTKCENPEAAYKFLKYLTFDKQGIEAKIDIVKTYNKADAKVKYPDFIDTDLPEKVDYASMPPTTNKEIIEKWVALNEAPAGIEYMMENMSIGYVDGFKVTPGFDDAYHKVIEKTFVEQVLTGEKSAADIQPAVQEQANKITKAAYELVNK